MTVFKNSIPKSLRKLSREELATLAAVQAAQLMALRSKKEELERQLELERLISGKPPLDDSRNGPPRDNWKRSVLEPKVKPSGG